jgi:hypothetical protein
MVQEPKDSDHPGQVDNSIVKRLYTFHDSIIAIH